MKQANIVSGTALLLAGMLALDAAAESGARESVIDWLADHAVPLDTDDPRAELDDLEPLDSSIGAARVVAAGEATHGSREFFRLKHRLFRYLVLEQGFRTFAIEANFLPSLAIDGYIKGGSGDAAELVHELGFWTWDTEEVIALVEWMRAYNADHAGQLSFYGFDVQDPRGTLAAALDYLEGTDTLSTPDFREPFQALLNFDDLDEQEQAAQRPIINSPASITRMQRAAMDLYLYIERNEADLDAATSAHDYRIALGHALATAWGFTMALPADSLRFHRSATDTEVRDRAMADLVHWIRATQGEDERIMLWAHNAHVGKTRHKDRIRTMGMLLANELGDDYMSIAFAFDRGAFQAFPPPDSDLPRTLTEFTVGPAEADWIGGVLAGYEQDMFYVDLRSLDCCPDAAAWFATPRRLRWTGAMYSDELEAMHPPYRIRDTFDAMIFVRETTRAWPSERSRQRFGLEAGDTQ